MTVKDSAGKVVWSDKKIFMPVPHQLGMGDRMGRGPYDKSGLLADWALHPLEEKQEVYRILLPTENGKLPSLEYTLEVELWYDPFGYRDEEFSQLFRKEVKKIKFSEKEPYPGA